MTEPPDLRTALQQTRAELATRADLRSRAALDAQQLVELATGLTRVEQLASPGRLLTQEEAAKLHTLLQRRLCAEPMQHLRGTQEFYGRDFRVSPDVLIPRPETEDIVTAVLEAVRATTGATVRETAGETTGETTGDPATRDTPLRIADVGTGSGALALTLALELPGAQVTGLDLSPAALAIAEQNAVELGLRPALEHGRVRLLHSDLFAAVAPGERFDIVVSNPPYIPLRERDELHPEVRDFEPHLALFAGDDGHSVYRRLIPEAWQHLYPGGLLVLETAGRVDLLQDMLRDWRDLRIRPDLQGIARIVVARRH